MTVFDDFVNWLGVEVAKLFSYITSIFDSGIDAVTDLYTVVMGGIESAMNTVINYVNNSIASVWQLVNDAAAFVKAQTLVFFDMVADVYHNIMAELANIYHDIKDFIAGILADVVDWMKGLTNEVKSYFDMGLEMLKQFFADQWDAVKDFLIYLKDTLIKAFDDTLKWLTDKINAAFDLILQAVDTLKTFVVSLWDSFQDYVKQLLVQFEKSLEDLVAIATDFFQALWDDIKDYVDSLTDVSDDQIEAFIRSTLTAQTRVMQQLAKEFK